MKKVWNSDEKGKTDSSRPRTYFLKFQHLWTNAVCFMLFFVACRRAARGLISTRKLCLDRHPSKRFVRFFFHVFSSSIGLWSRRSPRRGHWAIDLFAHWNLEETWAFPRVEQCVCSLGVHVPSPVWAFQSRIMAVGPNRHVLWPLKVVPT